MLGQRRRCWPNNKSTLGQRFVEVEYSVGVLGIVVICGRMVRWFSDCMRDVMRDACGHPHKAYFIVAIYRKRHRPKVGVMFGRRRRRWDNIKPI